jgi:outer membrane protein OmpA-like peptidoglycan-associated protein
MATLGLQLNKKALVLSSLVAFGALNSGCQDAGKKTAYGAGIGAAAGAAVGAVIGHQTGNRAGGALIGGALGGGLGGVVGNRLDKQTKELEAVAETKRTEQGLVSKLKSDILFDTGKAQLKTAATDNLTKMADIMKKYPENVLTVKGYTDSTGSKAINTKLSEQRASAVKNQLVAGGIPASTITVVGMADANPVAGNDTAAGRAQNRRVEIEVVVDESKVPANAK